MSSPHHASPLCRVCRQGRAAPWKLPWGGGAGGAHPGGGCQRRAAHTQLRNRQRWVDGWVGVWAARACCECQSGAVLRRLCCSQCALPGRCHSDILCPPPAGLRPCYHRPAAGIGLLSRAAVHFMAADPELAADPASRSSSMAAAADFRQMVSVLHSRNIEVLLEVGSCCRRCRAVAQAQVTCACASAGTADAQAIPLALLTPALHIPAPARSLS